MKTWDQFYIEYMIKRSKPYYRKPGWALAYNPWCSEQELLGFFKTKAFVENLDNL